MQTAPTLGITAAVPSFLLIGLGIGAGGTNLLALLAEKVDERRQAAAGSAVWIMMIFGLVVTAIVAGQLLDPYTPARLVAVTAGVAVIALALTLIGLWGQETTITHPAPKRAMKFSEVLSEMWVDPRARAFTIFVFASMTAYNLQDLILEPFAGYVGMVDREHFDEFLRARAALAGAERLTGTYLRIERDADETHVAYREKPSGIERRLTTKLIIGADGARSIVAKTEVPGGDKIPYVIACHEIVKAPESVAAANADYDPTRCDVIYDGRISPDFYGWVFPHGEHASIGMGTGIDDVDLKKATADLRASAGLSGCETIRREGAPIPLAPMDRWDNGSDVVLAGDAAGVVAPSSGAGIFYAMAGGRAAATAAQACLASGRVKDLGLARKMFMKEHGTVFKVLRVMQDAYYKSDERRERFVSLCHDVDVQKLTFEAYMNKKPVSARPLAHLKIGLKNMAHILRLVSPVWT